MRILNVKKLELAFKKLLFSESQSLKRRAERFYQKPVEHEIRLLRDLTNKQMASIDIGVYRGVYSYFLSNLSSHVYSFEANPLLHETLKKSLKDKKNVTLENIAISSNTGETNIRIPIRNKALDYKNYEEKYELGLATIHNENTLENKEIHEIEIKKIRLDDYSFNHPISFIKIDVEGHEKEIIDGATNLISYHKPYLLIEIEERHTNKPIHQIISDINAIGYECFILNKLNLKLSNVIDLNIDTITSNNFIFIPKDKTSAHIRYAQ